MIENHILSYMKNEIINFIDILTNEIFQKTWLYKNIYIFKPNKFLLPSRKTYFVEIYTARCVFLDLIF